MNSWFRFSTALLVAILATTTVTQAQQPDVPLEEDPSYNPDEDLKSFDLFMEPYQIPVETTTYVDFAFNLPEDAPEAYHVVFGEVINSQPLHLHHFVLTGCRNRVDEALVGLPIDDDSLERDCNVYLGQWAPGASVFGIADKDTGFLMGKGLGIEALLLNVHYTDGALEADGVTQKVATDGIRVHYTTSFRPYSSTPKDLIGIGSGPRQLVVPPGESRFFVTRSCKIESNCQDTSPERLVQAMAFLGVDDAAASSMLGGDVSCPSAAPLCGLPSEIGYWARRLCPATCGYCDEFTQEGLVNPLASNEYRVTSIGYHAHLLGREMYATHVREAAEEAISVATTKDASTTNLDTTTPSSEAIVTDMESRAFWIFDFQEVIPLQSEVVQQDNTTLRGLGVKTGDKIQVTCVYDSTYRDAPTRFDVSTYDEMCITTAHLTFATPESLLNGNTAAGVPELGLELELLSFSCAEDEASDVYTGTLEPGEDGRNIWRDHPIANAEGCTFPMSGVRAIWGTRNCGNNNSGGTSGSGDGDDFDTGRVCGNELELLPETNAGASCTGGTYDNLDANLGTTEDQCTGGGGVWEPYTCSEIDDYLTYEAEADGMDEETIAFLVADWFRPECCVKPSSQDEPVMDSNVEGDSESKTVPISAASRSGSMGWAVALITVANYVLFE